LALLLALAFGYFTSCGIFNETKTPASDTSSKQPSEVARGTQIGQVAPDFELKKVGGGKLSLADLHGAPAVLVFWTAWCPSCKEEAPHINRLAAEFEPKGVRVIGINIGESDARIAEGIKNFGIQYAVAKDRDATVAKSYKVVGTPTIVFLDKKSVVRYFGNDLPNDYAEILKGMLEN